MPFWSTDAQWPVLPPVLLALVLSALIGLEREVRAKSAGMRTHTLVGFGSAVFVIVSKYGFADLLGTDHIALDPSRIAAQIVSGIGFIGGGLIFVQRDVVRGLTGHSPPGRCGGRTIDDRADTGSDCRVLRPRCGGSSATAAARRRSPPPGTAPRPRSA